MKKRVTSFWKWIRDHLLLSIALAVLLVGAAYVIPLIPPPRGQECGTITYPNNQSQGAAAIHLASLKVLSCFWQAYQHCQRATINLSAIGTDAGEDVTLTSEPNLAGCDVYVDRNVLNKFFIFHCASMTQQAENLHLSQCDNGQAPFDIQPSTHSVQPEAFLPPRSTT